MLFLIFFLGLALGVIISFFILAMLSANKVVYSEEDISLQLRAFKNYWVNAVDNEHDSKLLKDCIEDLELGVMCGFKVK